MSGTGQHLQLESGVGCAAGALGNGRAVTGGARMQARLDITAENLKRIEKEEKKAARRGSLRVSGSGDSRTTSEASMDASGAHTAFGGDIDASNKAGLSSMLSRLSFRRPH